MILLFMADDDVIVQGTITRVKDAGDGKTNIWVVGQSATDGGFLIDKPFDEVMSLITDEEDENGAQEEEESE